MSHKFRHEDEDDDEFEQHPRKMHKKSNVVSVSYLEADSENIDSLCIKPPQAKDPSHGSRDKRKKEHHGSRSYHDSHRDQKYSHREKRHRNRYEGEEKDKRKRRKQSRRTSKERHLGGHKAKKGDLLGSRQPDACKYDAKKPKDVRHSHGDSESNGSFEIVDRTIPDPSARRGKAEDGDFPVHFGQPEYEDRYRKNDFAEESEMKEDAEARIARVLDLKIDDESYDRIIETDDSDSEKTESVRETSWKDADYRNDQSPGSFASQESKVEGSAESLARRSVSVEKDRPSPLSPVVDEAEAEEEAEVEPDLDESLPPYYPAVEGCRSVQEFQCLNRIEEGTYGVVYRFRDKRTNDIVALKKLKMEKEREGFPITSLREINTLLKSQHPNIVTVREIVVGNNNDKIFIVMDYVEHDLKSLMELMRHKNQKFMPGEVKCLLKQLLAAVAHLHDNWILHRDLKTSNLLLSHKGILKVGDFGLAREYGSPLKPYTPIVVTLWYRAPELLLGAKEYSTSVDVWSVGCIFAELLMMHALFPGKSEVEQLNRIFKCLGTPHERIWPGYSKLPAVQKIKFNSYPTSNLRKKFQMLSDFGLSLLTQLLTYDPARRTSAEEALQHSYFNEFPVAVDPSQFPKWPAKSELGRKRALESSPKPPSGGGEYKKLGGDEEALKLGLEADNGSRMGAGFSLKF